MNQIFIICSHFHSLAGLVLWYVILLLFCLFIAHTCDITDDVERCAEMAGVGRNVEWLVSQKGNEKLVVDHYLFICNGKGKPGHANVRYWSCNTNGCNVRPKRNGNNLVDLMGVVNPPDSGDANDHDRVNDLTFKVRFLIFRVEIIQNGEFSHALILSQDPRYGCNFSSY